MKNKDVGDIMKSTVMLIEGISHELVNKVATLQMKQHGMEKVFPALMQGYNIAVQNNLISEQLSGRILNGVGDLINLNEQLMPMLEFLARISHYMEVISSPQKEPEYSIRQSIQQIMKQPPFNSQDNLKKVQMVADEDFSITCPKLFVDAALYHLLHRLLYVESAESVAIDLLDEQHIVSITGYPAVSQSSLSRTNMFEHYTHELYDKSYPGLGLCRLALQLFGGDILIKYTDKGNVEYQLVFNIEK